MLDFLRSFEKSMLFNCFLGCALRFLLFCDVSIFMFNDRFNRQVSDSMEAKTVSHGDLLLLFEMNFWVS